MKTPSLTVGLLPRTTFVTNYHLSRPLTRTQDLVLGRDPSDESLGYSQSSAFADSTPICRPLGF